MRLGEMVRSKEKQWGRKVGATQPPSGKGKEKPEFSVCSFMLDWLESSSLLFLRLKS